MRTGSSFTAAVLAAASVLLAACADSPLAPGLHEPGGFDGGGALALLALEDKLTASDPDVNGLFGRSVAIEGDLAIVGEPGDFAFRGAAYVFRRVAGHWAEVAKLTAIGGVAFDQFGRSVALSGHLAVVGAPLHDANGDDSGAAYVFDGTAGWNQVVKLTAPDGEAGDQFGSSVAISGPYIIVGAPLDDADEVDSGSAYVYDNAGGGSVTRITASAADAGEQFGFRVAIDGPVAVVGAPGTLGDGRTGAAYVFHVAGPAPVELARLTASDGAADDQFGFSVAISGTVALVGSPRDGDNGVLSGSAYLFDGNAAWSQAAKLLPSDGAVSERFGLAVAMGGGLAVIGALFDDENGPNSGSAYVFDVGAGWIEVAKLIASDGASGDTFGEAVAISGAVALVGASFHDVPADNAGAVYAFELIPDAGGGLLTQDIADLLHELPDNAFKTKSRRAGLLSALAGVDAALAKGDHNGAIRKLRNMRRKVDGCGAKADNNDWIVHCPAQISVRTLIDALIAHLLT